MLGPYTKFIVALLGAIVEGLSLWQGAPPIVAIIVPFITSAMVWLLPNSAQT